MNDDTTAIAERPTQTDPMNLIAAALERGVSADQLGGFFALQERHERNQAEGAFARAITAFQAEMPAVHKGRDVQGKYKFASYDDIMRIAGPLLRKHQIVVTFDTAPHESGMLTTICKVRVGIHAEPTAVTLPVPVALTNSSGKQIINDTQAFAQGVSYGKRYALCAALNIVTTDEDTDANYPSPPTRQPANGKVTKAQVDELDALLTSLKDAGGYLAPEAVLKWLEAKDWYDLDQLRFTRGKNYINSLIAARKAVAK